MVRVPLASAFARSRDALGMLDARIQFGEINGERRNTTCGTGVSHVEDQPNVADRMWLMLLHLLPLDGVGPAVAEDE